MSSALYFNIQITIGIIGFLCDLFLFCTIIAFENLNSRFHYNLLKHWCCIDGSYLATLTLSKLFLYNISYDVYVTSCTLLTIVSMLFVTNYIILLFIAIDWTLSVYKHSFSEKLRNKKNALIANFYLLTIFMMCFNVRICVYPQEKYNDVYNLITTVQYFVFLTVLILIAVTHKIKSKRNLDLKKYNTFPLKLSLFGFLTWSVQFVVILLSLCGLIQISMEIAYFYSSLGMSTSIVYLILCLTCDKMYRDCLQYMCGCKAYDELINNGANRPLEFRDRP